MISGLPGWWGASSSVTRANGERSLWPAEFWLPSSCATPDEAVIAIGVAPALEKGGRSHGSRPAKNGSDHHRYGQVKTRLNKGMAVDRGAVRLGRLSACRLILVSKYQSAV